MTILDWPIGWTQLSSDTFAMPMPVREVPHSQEGKRLRKPVASPHPSTPSHPSTNDKREPEASPTVK
jgi:hypothetical protein